MGKYSEGDVVYEKSYKGTYSKCVVMDAPWESVNGIIYKVKFSADHVAYRREDELFSKSPEIVAKSLSDFMAGYDFSKEDIQKALEDKK